MRRHPSDLLEERAVAFLAGGALLLFVITLHIVASRMFDTDAVIAAPPSATTTEQTVRAVSIPEPTVPSTTTTRQVATTQGTNPAVDVERVGSGDIWRRVADCESGEWTRKGDPSSARPGSATWNDARGPYEGGLHFLPSTWERAGGHIFALHAYDATPDEQISVAMTWLSRTSVKQWPRCGPAMELTMADAIKGEGP